MMPGQTRKDRQVASHSAIVAIAMYCGMVPVSVTGATLFQIDNFTYELEGDLQIQLLKDSGVDEDLDIDYDDGELRSLLTYELNDGVEVFGRLDIELAKNDTVEREEAYVGLEYEQSRMWMGTGNYATDDFGVEKNIDVGGISGDAFPAGASSDVLYFEHSAPFARVALSHDLQVDDDLSSTDLFIAIPLDEVELEFAFQRASGLELDGEGENGEEVSLQSNADTVGIAARFDWKRANLALAYSAVDFDRVPGVVKNLNLALAYPIEENLKLNLGLEVVDGSDSAQNLDDMTDYWLWYVNAVREFPQAEGLSAFVEIGRIDAEDTPGIDLGYLAGLRLNFR